MCNNIPYNILHNSTKSFSRDPDLLCVASYSVIRHVNLLCFDEIHSRTPFHSNQYPVWTHCTGTRLYPLPSPSHQCTSPRVQSQSTPFVPVPFGNNPNSTANMANGMEISGSIDFFWGEATLSTLFGKKTGQLMSNGWCRSRKHQGTMATFHHPPQVSFRFGAAALPPRLPRHESSPGLGVGRPSRSPIEYRSCNLLVCFFRLPGVQHSFQHRSVHHVNLRKLKETSAEKTLSENTPPLISLCINARGISKEEHQKTRETSTDSNIRL